ncbi:MAG: hypothetical protein OHK0039_35810 [Bacteroidia bacterium]
MLLLIWLLPAQVLAQRPLSAADAQAVLEARQHVDTLCSRFFAGRGYADDGHVRAAAYLAGQFQRLGLEPSGNAGQYFQYFTIQINLVKGAGLTIDGQALRPGHDFIVYRASGAGEVAGRVVDMGYGLKPSKKAAGRIVLLRDGWPADIANDADKRMQYEDLAHLPQRLAALMPYKPLAFVVVQNKLTAGFAREVLPVPVVEVLTTALPARPREARLHVRAGLETLRTQNVIGMIRGSRVPDTAIVISAHYDHLGTLDTAYFPGASDNASGTAMLLSMAAYFAQPEHRPRYTLLFIAFGAEETGLLGSRHYVERDPRVRLAQIRFILNLDLMGNGIDGITAVGGKDYPAYFDQLVRLNDSLQAVPKVAARSNAPNSDHYFFLQAGVPGFFIYTLGGPPHYHDVNDTASHLELSRYAQVRRLLLAFLEQL